MLSSSTSSETNSQSPAGLPRVLLVDDSRLMLTWTTSVLMPDCVVVGAVTNGPAALGAARWLEPDVIVLDISIPDMSGLEIARRLREAGSPAALVFLSIHEEEEFIQAAKAVGAVGYVVKRRVTVDLIEAIRAAHAHRQFFPSTR
jgi:DNA-binding NarL/FixJ family response regulator